MHQQTVTRSCGEVVGREPELDVLERALAPDADTAAVVLTGEAGVGKTTLWHEGVAIAARHGRRVLSAQASSAEAELSFATVADLLHGIELEELPHVPQPQIRALRIALFQAEPTDAPPDAFAISSGFLNTLRALSDHEPIVVAVDDVQWLDSASADVLAFAGRRLVGRSVVFLLARRPGSPSELESGLESGRVEQVEVGRLSLGATRQLLSQRLGLTLPRRVVRQVFESTRGSPLFVLEVGRTLVARPTPRIGEALPVPERVEDMLGTRVAALPARVRRLLLALALSGEIRRSQLVELTDADTVDAAVAAGVVLVDGDRARPSHPLLAEAALSRAGPEERQALHLDLSRVTADGRLRVRHLALATASPDERLAGEVAAAAADAAGRGAVLDAVVLAEQALRLTQPAAPERPDRLLMLADYLCFAGEKRRVTDLLSPELETLPHGELRVRGYLLMPGGEITGNDEVLRYLELALAESRSDPRLHAIVRVEFAINQLVTQVAGVREAESWLLEMLPLSRRAGVDPYRDVLYGLAWARALAGRRIDRVCRRFRAASEAGGYMVASIERIAGQQLVWRGEVEQARPVLTGLLSLAEERGEPISHVLQRLHVCELEVRVGAWQAAERLLDEWAEPFERDILLWPMYERCRALLAAGRGLPQEADRWASEAIARAEATGVRWDQLEAVRARGIAALFAGDSQRAADELGGVWEYTSREGIDEPGVFPVAPELVEALVELGEVERAHVVNDRLAELAKAQSHPWGHASAERGAGLIALAERGWDDAAAGALEHAADAYGALGLRFDSARTLFALGRAQRRLKKWGAARRSLERAVAEFEEIGSHGWAETARSETARVGARRPAAPGELTPAEARVAELASDGLSNKEIAGALFITVNTVERHLKHVYAKLGIHSRNQLPRRLTASA